MVVYFFYFHPYLGKIPNLTNILQMGWNHRLEQSLQHFSASNTWLNAKELGPYLISMSLQSMLYPLAIAYAWFSWNDPTPWLDSKGVVTQGMLPSEVEWLDSFGWLGITQNHLTLKIHWFQSSNYGPRKIFEKKQACLNQRTRKLWKDVCCPLTPRP